MKKYTSKIEIEVSVVSEQEPGLCYASVCELSKPRLRCSHPAERHPPCGAVPHVRGEEWIEVKGVKALAARFYSTAASFGLSFWWVVCYA